MGVLQYLQPDNNPHPTSLPHLPTMLLLLLLPLAMGDSHYGAPPTWDLLATKYNAILLNNDAPPPSYANNYIQRPTSAFGGTRVYRSRRSLKKVASKAQRALNLASGGWKKAKSYASTRVASERSQHDPKKKSKNIPP